MKLGTTWSAVPSSIRQRPHRRQRKLQKLPPHYVIPTEPPPIAAGRVTFTRSGQVTPNGNVHWLSQTFKVGKRLKGDATRVKVVLDTQRRQLTAYRPGRVFKRWPDPFLKK